MHTEHDSRNDNESWYKRNMSWIIPFSIVGVVVSIPSSLFGLLGYYEYSQEISSVYYSIIKTNIEKYPELRSKFFDYFEDEKISKYEYELLNKEFEKRDKVLALPAGTDRYIEDLKYKRERETREIQEKREVGYIYIPNWLVGIGTPPILLLIIYNITIFLRRTR